MMLIFVCTLTGCGTSYHWTQTHPKYNQVPYGEISVAGTENAFVLTRTPWFAKKLEISTDSIQLKVTHFSEQVFLDELNRSYPKLSKIPAQIHHAFPEESQKLDERIFIKGHFPEQGKTITDDNGNTPRHILILHEFIIGTDLKRELYFDYALIHNENTEKKATKQLSAIVSYTLWDNEKQRPLFSAVDELQQDIIIPSLNDIERIVRSSVSQIRKNLYEGAVR